MKKILVSGGAGFIGSHTIVELVAAGYTPIVVDNFSNSSYAVLEQVEKITGQKVDYIELDLLNLKGLKQVFSSHEFYGVIHFAGLKAVGESTQIPHTYYRVNIDTTLNLIECMQEFNVNRLVFSSSATVYGTPKEVPIKEDFPLSATNPYGRTKLFIEDILRDVALSDERWNFVLLRYFNPVGAHPSGLIGEDPKGIPNNLMPYVARVAKGILPELGVFGDDYPTPDGTGVRDYIHVVDLAKAHVKALDLLEQKLGCEAFNVGTGKGYSVLEMVKAFGEAAGRDIPYQIKPRRAGDIAECWADSNKLYEATGWQAEYGIEEMCAHLWKFMQIKDPELVK